MRNGPSGGRLVRALPYLLPPLAALVVCWYGLRAWFCQDDFAWLNLRVELADRGDWLWALFAPMGQGTMRVWSERVLYLALPAVFGFDPLPFRILAFLTQFANLVLLALLIGRLTGSRLAAGCAAFLWAVHPALALPMSWSATYNQILCAFFLLAALNLYVRWAETGRDRLWWAQFAVFSLGFGALELNIVYPALVLAYTWFFARQRLAAALPMALVSAAYFAIYSAVAASYATGPYARHWGPSMLATFGTYWNWALVADRLESAGVDLGAAVWLITGLFTVALIGFAAAEAARRRFLPLVCAAWFLAMLLPYLALRDQLREYYLAVPSWALAAWGGLALARGWQSSVRGRTVAVLGATLYLAAAIPVTTAIIHWQRERSLDVRRLVTGVAHAARLHPGKEILLYDLPEDLARTTLVHNAFRAASGAHVAVAPPAPYPETSPAARWVVPASAVVAAAGRGDALVYAYERGLLYNISEPYSLLIAPKLLPARVEPGDPAFARYLAGEWHSPEGAYRWMGRRATVTLERPRSPDAVLIIAGVYPRRPGGTVPALTVTADGIEVFSGLLPLDGEEFTLRAGLPASSRPGSSLQVSLSLSETFLVPGDRRPLGAAIRLIELIDADPPERSASP